MPVPKSRPQPPVVRLRDLSSLVVAVEHMVGFRPTESLVAVALCGPRERMTFTLRLDLPEECDGDEAVDAIAAEVAKRMAYAEADSVILFIHTDQWPTGGRLPRRSLVDAVERALDAPLREAALVSGERMWSYVCTDRRCCPPQGRGIDRETPEALALSAARPMTCSRSVSPTSPTRSVPRSTLFANASPTHAHRSVTTKQRALRSPSATSC